MKKIILFGFLILIISCKNRLKEQILISSFDLKSDYLVFKEKMTERDTLEITMGVGSCMHQSTEKLTITKQNDTLKIESYIIENSFSNEKFKKYEEIKIHKTDTVWKLEKFIEKYFHQQSASSESKYPIFTIKKDTSRIDFFTKGISNRDDIVTDYCKVMKKIMPNSKFHFYADSIEVIMDTIGNLDSETVIEPSFEIMD